MLSVEEAREHVLAGLVPLEAESVPILSALGRVLARDVIAGYDIPPHANTAMDGYALRSVDTAGASEESPVRLRVIAELPAGYVAEKPVVPGTTIRIMTGAAIPPGADAVARFESVRLDGDYIEIAGPVPIGKEVRCAGEDVKQGALVLKQGRRLRPQDIGMLASIGESEVEVTRRPRVGVLATGDELVSIDAPLAPGKIRNTNGYSNAAQVLKYGGEPVPLGIASDSDEEITKRIRSGIEQGVDLLVVSGGVSVGDFDMVKKVLAREGEIDFWRVRMKPGKPLAFGHITIEGRKLPVLGMPGNPVSAMVSFEMFARPMILALLGASDVEHRTVSAVLADTISSKDDRRHFVRVLLEEDERGYVAYLTGDQGSGILTSMVEADGLAIIPEEWRNAEPGVHVQVILLGDTL
ncbi:MAG TPA: molybdopterin molybdenumtransferase MoeA [Candidatus Acetothermia bacterium]|nr:molybdopterin molybdenumtransferase MoeA [Candidatus Acetothermia bacterium]